mmetsp:Transcript_42485/g.68315  ORF Transcript_42485/g.68315 Transcript_42485/m.68315 type:complete len:208 (+) Transcript_42485:265-888(+)
MRRRGWRASQPSRSGPQSPFRLISTPRPRGKRRLRRKRRQPLPLKIPKKSRAAAQAPAPMEQEHITTASPMGALSTGTGTGTGTAAEGGLEQPLLTRKILCMTRWRATFGARRRCGPTAPSTTRAFLSQADGTQRMTPTTTTARDRPRWSSLTCTRLAVLWRMTWRAWSGALCSSPRRRQPRGVMWNSPLPPLRWTGCTRSSWRRRG